MTPGTLYVVATPLGHLDDLSDRARDVLRRVGVVAAEDTRRTRALLTHVGAHPRLHSYHAHSPEARLHRLVETLETGTDVALVTDAGTPTVSDPGVALVRHARRAGAPVVTIPGPSAVTAALSVAGLPADRYTFLGFLPRKGAERRRLLETTRSSPWTVVLFESAARLVRLLQQLADGGEEQREAVVARELTKVHEEVKAGTLRDLAVYYEQHPPRGEVTVLVAGCRPAEPTVDRDVVRQRARDLLAEGNTRRDVANQLAAEFPVSRRDAYRTVTNL